MLDKLAYWHQKLTTSTINGDEQLKTYLKLEVRVKTLNLEIVKVINDINNKDYSINNLRKKLHQYDLIMRELQESDVQSWTEKFVFSISLYEQYMEFNKLVYADLKSNIHSYLGVFVDEMNNQLQKLIINMESNSEQDFKMIVSFKQRLQQFQEDILYLKRDDFIREFPIKFIEINNNLHQAMLLLATQEKQMIASFISHFKEWKSMIIKQKEKITESGVWEKIEKLNQMFNASYTNLKQVEKASQDFNFSVVHKLVKEIQEMLRLSKILCLDNSFWIILKRRRTENDKKIKKEPDAIDKVVDYFLENIDNPQDLFKGNTIFQEFTKKLTERMLNTEIKDHLETDENHNKRNGNTQKTIFSKNGSIAIDVPRDRNSTFEPVIISKRQRRFDNFDQKVISLYARGMTISDIKAQLQEFYHGAEISESLISQITDDVIEEVKMWQTKPLEKIYPIVYFDCIVVKVKQDKRIINKAVYLASGINLDGLKDILGMWISENEGAKFWLNNFMEMKNRGLQDILIACSDNLTGMSVAIEAVFPKTQHQLCIVHQIRNSLKFVPYKDRKLVANDLKSIYTAINEEIALVALDHFSEKWNKKYPQITKSWKNNWDNLIIFIEYPQEFRRIIYTTNAIESVNSQLRKVVKNKKIFPNDLSVFKICYLAFQNMTKKWTMPIQNWGSAISHLMIKFEDRVNLS